MERVRLGGPHALIAEIIHGDSEQHDRNWVCIRTESPTSAAWINCWSQSPGQQAEQGIQNLLRELAGVSDNCVSIGPLGPVLGEHLFFPGWQSWGPGTPLPLQGLKLDE
jgi:hypothetical protein